MRTVTQSTMRGGDKFWDFRTFNPPISKNNWANEYTEDCEIHRYDSTKVVRNTYLDVPTDWLGEQFIEEAEELKRVNERAYIHEYLGKAIGTGGDVFPNVEDMDMEVPVHRYDMYGNVKEEVPMWKTFDKIYNGLDWGFAIDPTRFVRLHFNKDSHSIYIFDEYDTRKARIREIYDALYVEHTKITNEELLIADPGGGGAFAIADFKAYGAFIRQAVKGPESVNYGIKWLQGLKHIYIDKRRCPETWKEFTSYEYEQDKDGNFISSYPDENNHSIDACLSGNTLVHTPVGDVTIESLIDTEGSIYAYDIVNKKIVEANYIHCRLTRKNAELWKVMIDNGVIIECTYDHKIYTGNRGYVMASELNTGDDVLVGIVTSIQKTNKKEDVYDLEVPNYHNFILANGVVVHNCRYALEKYCNRKGN